MVDPLHVAANAPSTQKWADIVKEVVLAAESTKDMTATAGRASKSFKFIILLENFFTGYTSKSNQQWTDPGAKGFAIWFKSAYEAIERTSFNK